MLIQKKQLYGFAVLTRGTKKTWWSQVYKMNPLCEILRITKQAGAKPIASIKIYLK